MTQADIDLLLTHTVLDKYIRIDVLNTSYVKTGELQGLAISLTPNISNSSDIKRTCSLKMVLQDKTDLSAALYGLWINRIIKPYLGLYDGNSTTWYLIGSFLISENGYTYDATTQELDLSLVDMMAAATEIRGSQIGGAGIFIPAETNARSALIATVAQFSPFIQYNVVELPDTIPYDMEYEADIYPYQILKDIMAFFPLHQMYYSQDGVFTVRRIPDGIDDPVVLDNSVLDIILKGEGRSNSHKDIKNTTEIFGMSLDAGYTASTCVTSTDTYALTFSTPLETMEANSTYSFTADSDSISGMKIKVDSLTAYPLYIRDIGGTESVLPAGSMLSGVPYMVKYTSEKFFLEGELDIHVIVQEVTAEPDAATIAAYKAANNCRNVYYVVNPNSLLAANVIGEKKQVKRGSDYENIYTTILAKERGIYENYKSLHLKDKVTLKFKLIPFLDVNQKISYTSSSGDMLTVMVQDISWDLESFTMDVTANLYYPDSPWIDNYNDYGSITDKVYYRYDYGLVTDSVVTSIDLGSVA